MERPKGLEFLTQAVDTQQCSAHDSSMTAVFDLARHPVHLGLGAKVIEQPVFGGDMAWYEAYARRTGRDGVEGRLVSLHQFSESWDSWEMHPSGEELVVCIAGKITVTQEIDGQSARAVLSPGQAIINPAGVWHTADVEAAATALFITAGVGTQHRAR